MATSAASPAAAAVHGSRPLRLAVVSYGLQLGGSERQLYLFLSQHDPSQWQPQVFLTGTEGPGAEQVRALGIPVLRLQGSAVRKSVELRRRCRQVGADVLLSWASWTNVYALSLLGTGILRIGSFRNATFADLPESGRRLWATASMGAVSRALCNSPETAADIDRRGLPTRYVPNAVEPVADIAAARTAWRRRLGIGPDDLLVVGIGRLTHQKNFPRFVTAVARAAERAPAPVRAVIVGPDRWGVGDDLRRHIAACGMGEDRVRLLGAVPEARELVCAADVFMLSSDHEGMPNVVLEAMVAGRPVVTTRVNGVADLLTDGREGFVADHDAGALAHVLERLFRDTALRREMGRAAAARVASTHSSQAVYGPVWNWLSACALSGRRG